MALETITDSAVVETMSEGVRTVLSSVTLTLAAAGVLLILTGFVLQTGVMAALLPIWGAGLLIVGLSAYGLIRYSRR